MPKEHALSKKGWRLQKAFKELEEWGTWAGRSAEVFVQEIDANPPEDKEFTAQQIASTADIRKGLHDLQKLIQKLNKDLRRASGRRLRRKAV